MPLRFSPWTAGCAAVLAVAACGGAAAPAAPALTPQQAVDELLTADRGFAAASGDTDLVNGLAPMFAADVTMPQPGGVFAEGKERVLEALRGNPDNAGARMTWTPVRGGISADGRQGFTYGYFTVTRADSTSVPGKYLAYWVKGPEGWRVAAYKRRARPAGDVPLALMAPSLPGAMVAPGDSAAIATHGESLAQVERDFSRDAQSIGLGPAFAQYGSADAMNMGGPADTAFVIGAEAIARVVSAGGPATGSPVTWGPDRVIVSSSGDLGVTIGVITANTPAADGSTPKFAFFTVWHRAAITDPWRYIAE